jgi:hypothetical protein
VARSGILRLFKMWIRWLCRSRRDAKGNLGHFSDRFVLVDKRFIFALSSFFESFVAFLVDSSPSISFIASSMAFLNSSPIGSVKYAMVSTS